jgi:hypothetical protein
MLGVPRKRRNVTAIMFRKSSRWMGRSAVPPAHPAGPTVRGGKPAQPRRSAGKPVIHLSSGSIVARPHAIRGTIATAALILGAVAGLDIRALRCRFEPVLPLVARMRTNLYIAVTFHDHSA